MNQTIITQVLPCDPTSISFSDSNGDSTPIISSEETLASLKTAVSDLVSLNVPVVFPTETVYGLAAPALISSAVSQIFTTKGRPADNPLIVHVSSPEMLKSILPSSFVIPSSYNLLMQAFWPGPLTLLFPATPQIPSIITASRDTVAIRMPSHPVARALIQMCNTPLAAPSANTSGSPSPTKAEHVLHNLFGKVRVILDGGPCDVGLESTVVDGLSSDGAIRVLRPGGVTVEDMERVLAVGGVTPKILVHRRDFRDEGLENAPTTPGMKYRHYSPSIPVVLLLTSIPPENQTALSLPETFSIILSSYPPNSPVKIGLLTPSDSPLSSLPSRLKRYAEVELNWDYFPLGTVDEPSLTAQRLFDGLLTLERNGVDLIIVEGVEEAREGLAVMNRVRKAAGEVHWVAVDEPLSQFDAR
ncbi:hypothetical protein Clacol_010550 [Clathrus columnatus]|uniref:Threonylcarbamoyl-AMP synthase n=1 Tax=Clathrus columnatus TaxID=1419009 RepID=A0AAV5AU88_9AGAM|nr:hypothetical protein Clacol_010550 [Clathrus columnatus]